SLIPRHPRSTLFPYTTLFRSTGDITPHLPGVLRQAVTKTGQLRVGLPGKQPEHDLQNEDGRQQHLDHLPGQSEQQGVDQTQPEVGGGDVLFESVHFCSLVNGVHAMKAENSTSCFCSALISRPMTSVNGCCSKMMACRPATNGI